MNNRNSTTLENDSVQLSVVHSVYKYKTVFTEVDDKKVGQQQEVLKKQISIRKWFLKDGITSIEDSVTAGNTICKKRCIIFDKYSGKFYELFHSADEVICKISNTTPKYEIGFHHDTTIHPRKSSVYEPKKGR